MKRKIKSFTSKLRENRQRRSRIQPSDERITKTSPGVPKGYEILHTPLLSMPSEITIQN